MFLSLNSDEHVTSSPVSVSAGDKREEKSGVGGGIALTNHPDVLPSLLRSSAADVVGYNSLLNFLLTFKTVQLQCLCMLFPGRGHIKTVLKRMGT